MSTEPSSNPAESTGTEYVVSPALRRRLQQCYEHASSLMNTDGDYDYDYANTMFTECVARDPNNLVYVEAFLENLQRKYKNNKKGARTLSFGGGKGGFKKIVAKEEWAQVLEQGPALLKTNPWDVTVLRGMAQACEASQFNEVELRYLKNALDANPKDIEVNRHCAKSLARMGQFDQAIACWHRVEEANKKDAEAPKMISALTIEKNRARAGFGGTELPTSRPSSASAAPEKSAAKEPPPSFAEVPEQAQSEQDASDEDGRRRAIQLTPRQKLERAIVSFPEGLDNYLALADLHSEEQRHAEAEKVLTKALSVSGGDVKVQEKLEDATVLRLKHQLAVAMKRASVKQSGEANQLVTDIRNNLARYELEVLQSRTQRYPDNEALKYQLGRRLRRLGNLAEAVRELQAVESDMSCKGAARLELGECLQQLKQYPRSLLAYEHAIDAAEQTNQLDVRKLALYRAGVLATALRQLDSAERHLGTLRELDANFKDVADRLDKIRQIRDKE